MKKFLPVLCILLLVFVFGGAICEDDDDPAPVNIYTCANACQKFDDCDLLGDGPLGADLGDTVAECTAGCESDPPSDPVNDIGCILDAACADLVADCMGD